MTPDLINGIFEALGAAFICLSIRRIFKDKKVAGVSVIHVAFFVAWGYWNVYYYHNLQQTFSWIAGVAVCTANTVWLAELVKYWRPKLPVRKITYTVLQNDENLEDRLGPVSQPQPFSDEWAAECCAEEYYDDSAWEAEGWPLTFVLFNEDGVEIDRFDVDLEYDPQFTAIKKK